MIAASRRTPRDFFRDVEHFDRWPAKIAAFPGNLCSARTSRPRHRSDRRNGALLYRSPKLRVPLFRRRSAGNFITTQIDGRSVRMGEFIENGLTLRVGADLKEINQIGRDIFFAMLGAIPTVLLLIVDGSRWVAGRALAPIEESGRRRRRSRRSVSITACRCRRPATRLPA